MGGHIWPRQVEVACGSSVHRRLRTDNAKNAVAITEMGSRTRVSEMVTTSGSFAVVRVVAETVAPVSACVARHEHMMAPLVDHRDASE